MAEQKKSNFFKKDNGNIEKEEKKRYNEKKVVTDFLINKNIGIDFLVEIARKFKDNSKTKKERKTLESTFKSISYETPTKNKSEKYNTDVNSIEDTTMFKNQETTYDETKKSKKNDHLYNDEIEKLSKIDEIIDLYFAWFKKCPAKTIQKGTVYEGMKVIEKYSSDDEIRNLYSYMFIE